MYNKLFLVILINILVSQTFGIPCWGWNTGNNWGRNKWSWNKPSVAPKPTTTISKPTQEIPDCSEPCNKHLPECV